MSIVKEGLFFGNGQADITTEQYFFLNKQLAIPDSHAVRATIGMANALSQLFFSSSQLLRAMGQHFPDKKQLIRADRQLFHGSRQLNIHKEQLAGGSDGTVRAVAALKTTTSLNEKRITTFATLSLLISFMQYNTQREKLVIAEYGRYMQSLARGIAKFKTQEERTTAAKYLIELMSQASPQFRNIEEYRHKLWDHLIMISDFKLVVDSPYPFPERKAVVEHSNKPLPYPKHKIKMKHYGRNLETLVGKADQFEGDKKEGMALVVANYMKLCYANWSKEIVMDESIRQDLQTMSKGELKLDENVVLETPAIRQTTQQKPFGKNRNKHRRFGNNNRRDFNKGGGGGGNFRRRK